MSATPLPAAHAIVERRPAIVHPAWMRTWWGAGDAAPDRRPALSALFGAAPSLQSLAAAAEARRGAHVPPGWVSLLRGPRAGSIPEDALVVLAGQQPILLGGAALVAHKAATAIALARQLAEAWGRPVVPVFLLATEDHDSSEVDHLDFRDRRAHALRRVRCPLTPAHDRFFACSIDEASFLAACREIAASQGANSPLAALLDTPAGVASPATGDDLQDTLDALRFSRDFSTHVERLLHAVLGPLGLVTVRAHEVTARAPELLATALARREALASALADGAARLRELGLPASFDAADPRPLLLESRGGRRRRLSPDDAGSADRLRADPQAFSPHAALRPVVQARVLPVIAQVCGPSEIVYLGQARRLHDLLEAVPPVLVPRLEATAVDAELLAACGGDLAQVPLPGSQLPARSARSPGPRGLAAEASASRPVADASPSHTAADASAGLAEDEAALLQAARAFAARATALEPDSAAAAERWLQRVEHGARRLAERPLWRGHLRQDALWSLRPRGRAQDTVLAWLPDAVQHGRPRAWAEHIVSLCRPLDPPAHVLHVPPGAARDG